MSSTCSAVDWEASKSVLHFSSGHVREHYFVLEFISVNDGH